MVTAYLARTAKALACVAATALALSMHPVADRVVEPVAQYSHGGCTMRDGPGDFAQNCFTVTYSGPTVLKLWSFIQAVKYPAFPATVCEATFEVWGTLASGAPYRYSKVARGCSAISNGLGFEGLDLVFKPGSTICSRSLWQNSWSNPSCVGAPDGDSWSGRPWSPHQK